MEELEKKKKATARNIKCLRDEVNYLQEKVKKPISLLEAFHITEEILPDVAITLQLILICPASGAVVERGFSLMNLIMNELRSSMKVSTLDATMRINYKNSELLESEVDEIIEVWQRWGNRRIEL